MPVNFITVAFWEIRYTWLLVDNLYSINININLNTNIKKNNIVYWMRVSCCSGTGSMVMGVLQW